MSDTFDDIFNSDNTTDQPIEAIETEQHDAAPADVEPERPEPVEEVEALVTEAPSENHADEDAKTGKSVPLPTFLDMRDRMKAAEKLAADHQAKLEEYQKSQQVSASIPDPFNDPKGYADYRFAEVEKQRVNDKILMSGEFAKRTHGVDAVAAAANWASAQAEADPNFDAMVASQPDPIEWVIQQHKAATQLSEYQSDPIAAARKIALEQGWISGSDTAPVVAPVIPAATPTKAKVRPTTLNDIPASTSKATPQSEQESFNSFFNPR